MKNQEKINKLISLQEEQNVIIQSMKTEDKPVAGWYKDNGRLNESWLGYFDGKKFTYGFSGLTGEWCGPENDYSHWRTGSKLSPASPKEVETRLIQEAEKRGFKEGVEFISTNGNQKHTLDSSSFIYEHLNDVGMVLGTSDVWFFAGGKWATIDKPKLTLGGHEEKDIIFFVDGFLHMKYCSDTELSLLTHFKMEGCDTLFSVDELKELLTKIDEA